MTKQYRLNLYLAAFLLAAVCTPRDAKADTILTYVGNPFIQFANQIPLPAPQYTGGRITLSLDFATALGPLPPLTFVNPTQWSISDGTTQITSVNCPTYQCTATFQLTLDPQLNVTGWAIQAKAYGIHPGYITSLLTADGGLPSNTRDESDTFNIIPTATSNAAFIFPIASGEPLGKWTVVTGVPEPPSLSLLVIGLAGLGLLFRHGMA